MGEGSIRVLLIEDNPVDALLIKRALRQYTAIGGFELERVEMLREALQRLDAEPFDVVLLDLGLPDSSGLETLERVREKAPDLPAVVLTGADDEHLALEAAQHGAQDYFIKGSADGAAVVRGLRYAIERKRSEEALQRSEERARVLLENVSEAVLVLDERGIITWASPSAEDVLAVSSGELLGSVVADRVHDSDRNLFDSLLRGDASGATSLPVDVRVRDANGGWRVLEALARNRLEDPRIGSVLVTLRDMTERRRLEHTLIQSQRIESVGRLAGGIAHDFNNLLTAVLSYCQLVSRGLPPESKLQEYVAEIERAGERASALTRQLLVFSRGQGGEPELVDCNELIAGMDKLLRRTIVESVRIDTRLSPAPGRVRVDPSQLEQVVLNLAINAQDAMPGGGTLTLETSLVRFDSEQARRRPGAAPGEYAIVAVSDTGVGMSENVMSHLFEPFFTTKAFGKGTGLGMSIVHGIVRNAGGHVLVNSELGHGTSVEVCLPHVPHSGRTTPPPPAEVPVRGGHETVLLVEDEPSLREVVRRTLVELGYQPIDVASPAEALEFVTQPDVKVDLLLTDLVMPGMGGVELAEIVGRLRPGLPVVLMSGYPAAALEPAHSVSAARWGDLLTKPFTPDTLARKVRAVLDRNA